MPWFKRRPKPSISVDWDALKLRSEEMEKYGPSVTAWLDQMDVHIPTVARHLGVDCDNPREVFALTVGLSLADGAMIQIQNRSARHLEASDWPIVTGALLHAVRNMAKRVGVAK